MKFALLLVMCTLVVVLLPLLPALREWRYVKKREPRP